MMFNPIPDFISDYEDLKKFLLDYNQVSLENNVEHHMRKVMLLSCASYFETEVQDIIRTFVKKKSLDHRVLSFVNSKAIERQYHTYFQWGGNNINSFLGLFGNEFKTDISERIKNDEKLQKQVKAFLELGNERNKMVHENFLSYRLEKTFDEIVELYNLSKEFIAFLRNSFE